MRTWFCPAVGNKMAKTRREYIFGAFVLSVLCVIIVILCVSSDSWIVLSNESLASEVNYGLFGGTLVVNLFATSTDYTLHMTCLPDINACAVSCKTDQDAREAEVRALAEGFGTNQVCSSVTIVENRLGGPAVLSFSFYVSTVVLVLLLLVSAVVSAVLAIVNAVKNPTEPVFGLPGCLWSNVVTSVLGLSVMMTFGIYWATSGLQSHLAFSYIAVETNEPGGSLGYSYWVLTICILCSLGNVVLIEVRKYLLERDPPPPEIKMDNHSDGTVFLY